MTLEPRTGLWTSSAHKYLALWPQENARTFQNYCISLLQNGDNNTNQNV